MELKRAESANKNILLQGGGNLFKADNFQIVSKLEWENFLFWLDEINEPYQWIPVTMGDRVNIKNSANKLIAYKYFQHDGNYFAIREDEHKNWSQKNSR
ncbi:hypothetical protein G9G63_09180 [Paenibacillus sp. EKM202P]|uniref:hypothetical protein n=1 Tax=unclassified Paenibacillus TaxID=185978 RepID=UPI0013EAB82A|nr:MULTISPECIES: hypothetical protein [unclassified Paenibacillus]KAF6565322.1 hypothetical protein G9G63_09180 [Paenibacillus sp. EKM202P]